LGPSCVAPSKTARKKPPDFIARTDALTRTTAGASSVNVTLIPESAAYAVLCGLIAAVAVFDTA
jgi:hypothetical protein